MEDEGTNVLLSFMKKNAGNTYIWPDPQGVALQAQEDILCTVNPPRLKNERSQFTFATEDFDQVKGLFEKTLVYFLFMIIVNIGYLRRQGTRELDQKA